MDRFSIIKYLLAVSIVTTLVATYSCQPRSQEQLKEFFTIESEGKKLRVEVVTDSILKPFGMDFLPNGTLLVTDRTAGQLFSVNTRTGKKILIAGVPNVLGQADGGMLDILVHPGYKTNGWLYYSYSIGDSTGSTMVVDRAKLSGNKLTEHERLFEASPYYKEPNHFGCRLVLQDGYLFITMGDRYDLRDSAQTLNNHLGKIMRIHEDGKIPIDNPFVSKKKALPEIWSYGHRNPQGLTLHPVTGELWEHEHGPKGGDEVNIIKPGNNYGWPTICYGINYDDTPVNNGLTEKKGLEQPHYYYTPSIAPSGMEFYTSDVIPFWKGNLFIGAMALTHLNRLIMENNKVVKEERLLTDKKWRVRSVKQGPDGYLYIGIDGGKILRIRPE